MVLINVINQAPGSAVALQQKGKRRGVKHTTNTHPLIKYTMEQIKQTYIRKTPQMDTWGMCAMAAGRGVDVFGATASDRTNVRRR